MLHLLDANVLIDANRDYYPMDRVPEFWGWLQHQGSIGNVKVPVEVWEEIKEGTDELAQWIKKDEVRNDLLLDEPADVTLVSRAAEEGYVDDLTDDEVLKLGRDPFLVAYALVDPANRCVVTTEVSKPSKTRANRKLPDVCRSFGISSYNTFDLTRRLDFSTDWETRV